LAGGVFASPHLNPHAAKAPIANCGWAEFEFEA
jgi:hypothetical protein